MSFEQDQARLLAQRIARRMSQSADATHLPSEGARDVNEELALLRVRLDELQKKLARIESKGPQGNESAQEASDALHSEQAHVATGSKPNTVKTATRSPWLSGMYFPATHPSEEKFGVNEAAVSELVDFFEGEKICDLEPGGKPCDHCGMCSARGF